MDNLSRPEQAIRIFRGDDSEFHILVGLPMGPSLLQTLRQVDMGSLGGNSWKCMDPAHLPPGLSRVPRLLFKLSSSATVRVLPVIDQSRGKLQLPSLYRVAVVPDEEQTVMVKHRN